MPELSNWSVLVSKMVLMENFLHHLYTSYMNEPFKVDFDGGEAKGGDFKSGPGRERGFRRKTSNCICICCFHCCRILPEKSDFKIRRHNVQGTYRTSREILLCIFRVRESRSEKWQRLHLQLCPNIIVQLPKYLVGCGVCRENNNSRNVINCSHKPRLILSVTIFSPKTNAVNSYDSFPIDSCRTNCKRTNIANIINC